MQLALLVLIAIFAEFLGACSGDEESSPAEVPVPTSSRPAGLSAPVSNSHETSPNPLTHPSLATLRAMVETYPLIVVGEVLPGSELYYYEEDYNDVYPGARCSDPLTIFQVRPDQVIYSSDADMSPSLPVVLWFGPEKDDCAPHSDVVASEAPPPPLSPGERFLFLLQNTWGISKVVGYSGERFEIGEDGRLKGNGTEVQNAGPAALVGLTAEEAADKLRTAIAEGPLPAIPTWLQPYLSPVPSTVTSATPTSAPTATTPAEETPAP